MSWKGVSKKEAFMPLFAEDWNLVVDSLNDLYALLWGPVQHDLIPSADGVFNLGSYYYRFRNLFALNAYFSSLFSSLIQFYYQTGIWSVLSLYLQTPELRATRSILSQYIQTPEIRADRALLSTYLQSPQLLASWAILSQYLLSTQVTGTRGDFTQLYVKGTPVEALGGAVKTLTDIYTDIWPALDLVYRIGLPNKRFLWIQSLYGYISQIWTDALYLAGQSFPVGLYAAIEQFYPEAYNQLFSIAGQTTQDIKVLVSESLAREIMETKTYTVDTSQQSSPFILPAPPPFTNIVVKNWYLLTNSTTGDIQLKTVYTGDLIGWLPASQIRQTGNTDLWLPLYYDDYLQLLWLDLYLYSLIFLQITLYQRPCDISIRG